MEEELTRENQDSIKLVKTTKGYTWEIKRYYDFSKVGPEQIVVQLANIDIMLTERFGGK